MTNFRKRNPIHKFNFEEDVCGKKKRQDPTLIVIDTAPSYSSDFSYRADFDWTVPGWLKTTLKWTGISILVTVIICIIGGVFIDA